MSEEIKKKLWRYCPFSWYDTEYLQRWLEKQAAKGNFLSGSGFIGHFAIMIQSTNYSRTKSAFYSGWKSGKGCVMVVYDNEAPYVYAK